MKYIIIIQNKEWFIDLDRKILIMAENPSVVRKLNLERLEWFRNYVLNVYGRHIERYQDV